MVSTPHISANKLGEYMFAPDAKKRSILKTLKFPSTFMNARYTEAQSAFVNFMAAPDHNKAILEKKRNQVANKTATTDWQKSQKQCALEAIDHLLACSETILVDYLVYVAEKGLTKEAYDKVINGVTLHLKPEVLMVDKVTHQVTGFVKLAFTKSRAVDILEADVIASAIKAQIEKQFEVKLKPQNCLVLDVFKRRKFTAQKFNQTNQTKIKMACNEIAAMWPSIN